MANDIREAWSEYRVLILAELERQNSEIKANQADIRRIEKESAANKAKLQITVIIVASIVSAIIAIVEGLI